MITLLSLSCSARCTVKTIEFHLQRCDLFNMFGCKDNTDNADCCHVLNIAVQKDANMPLTDNQLLNQ